MSRNWHSSPHLLQNEQSEYDNHPPGGGSHMIKVIAGVFLVLHGLVHLLYLGQSARRFELQPGMTWPDGSWAFSKLLGANRTRRLASLFCILAAAGFVIAGVGIFFGQSWWSMAVLTSAA